MKNVDVQMESNLSSTYKVAMDYIKWY